MSFIEINTPLPDIVGNEGLKVVQSADSSSSLDSIKLSFLIPNQWDLKITVSTNTLQNFDFIYSKINRELSLPNNIESFSFHIAPTRLIAHLIAHSINCFYGAVGFDSLREYQIEKPLSKYRILVIISIPTFSNLLDNSCLLRLLLQRNVVPVWTYYGY